jgi:hypothetical protein
MFSKSDSPHYSLVKFPEASWGRCSCRDVGIDYRRHLHTCALGPRCKARNPNCAGCCGRAIPEHAVHCADRREDWQSTSTCQLQPRGPPLTQQKAIACRISAAVCT